MNRLTAIFLQELYEYAPQKQELLDKARREMLLQMDRALPELLSPGTLIGSAKGQELRQQAVRWKQQVEQCDRMGDFVQLLQELEQLQKAEQQLHDQTRSEIRKAGFVNGANLHLFYHGEQRNALQVLDEVIRVELFRIAALGGKIRFQGIVPLAAVPYTLPERLAYYRDNLMPVLQGLNEATLYGCWTFRFQEECRTGPLGKLPAYLPEEPNASQGENLLPGEYRVRFTSKGTVYQGAGCLTNLTPDTVEQAQRATVQDRIPVAELAARLPYQEDPVRALAEYFGRKPYIVDPYELFAAADTAQGIRTLMVRGQARRCLLCGRELAEHIPVCEACMEKVCPR